MEFFVLWNRGYEGDSFCGIYSTSLLAEAQIPKRTDRTDWTVEPVTLDKRCNDWHGA